MGGTSVVAGLVAFSLFKKVAVYGAARYYGFPRLYRKAVRLNRRASPSPEMAERLNATIKYAFRLPNVVYSRLAKPKSSTRQQPRAKSSGSPTTATSTATSASVTSQKNTPATNVR